MAGDRFGAFISYARAASSTLALDLQNGLERFAKPWNKLRAVRIFRDDASMSANTALWSTIQRALEQSEWFVLLATPQAAASEYVNDEITWWVTHKGADKLLLVHAGGTVDWDDDAGDFSAVSDAIPAALRGAYKEEPRWVDVTWYGEAGSLRRADPRFIERVADLSATVRGIEKDVLLGENVRQHRKTRRLTRAAIASLTFLLVIAVVTGGFAFVQRSEAVRQRDAATEQSLIARSRQLAATAVSRADTDLQSGLLLATTAYRTRPEYQTTQALHEVVSATPQLTGFYDFGEPLTAVDATPDAKVLVGGTESGKVYRFDRATGGRTELLDLGATVEFAAISDDGNNSHRKRDDIHRERRATDVSFGDVDERQARRPARQPSAGNVAVGQHGGVVRRRRPARTTPTSWRSRRTVGERRYRRPTPRSAGLRFPTTTWSWP